MHYQQKIPVQEAFTTKQAHITWVSVGGLTAERFTLPHLFLPLPVTTICFCDTYVTSAMLSIFGRAGATPPVVVEKPHALSCVL